MAWCMMTDVFAEEKLGHRDTLGDMGKSHRGRLGTVGQEHTWDEVKRENHENTMISDFKHGELWTNGLSSA